MSPTSRSRHRPRTRRKKSRKAEAPNTPAKPESAPGRGGIVELEKQERENFAISLQHLPEEFVRLVDDGFELYQWLANREAASDGPDREVAAVSQFIVSAGMNFLLAAVATMRAHGS